ncbi:MAG: arylamine N-acetyltransferase [Anaerolineales bacterium]|nr:arylamine N-acetyltransferase [Anaerolineales bacterium]
MKTQAYLQRINYTGPLEPTAETLRALHLAHLLAVPFENLDISLGRPIIPDETAFFRKIVERRRGGFCYELNGLFAALLRELGFDVTLLSARVARESGGFGPEFDHLTLLVRLEERWLADVGFGDCFREPLRLDEPGEQRQKMGSYRLSVGQTAEVSKTSAVYETRTLWELSQEAGWQPQYRFTLQPRRLADFAGMCYYHQRAPESHFTQKRVCSLATPEGRITLSDSRLIVSQNGQRAERELSSQAEVEAALREWFRVSLVSR